jgi:hypothetical protein
MAGTIIDSLLRQIDILQTRFLDEVDRRKSAEVDAEVKRIESNCWKMSYAELSEENKKLKEELVRRGADHPDKPKPPCDTAFAALQVVCNSWDREECFQDLRKQREELLRRVRALKSGRDLKMDDVVEAMREDGRYPKILAGFDFDLHYTLAEMKEQLGAIWDATPKEQLHEEWGLPPLSTFMVRDESDESEVDSDL